MVSTALLKVGFFTKCTGGTQGSFPILFPSNFGRPYLSHPNSVWGVLRLYGKPIESRFFLYSFGLHWVYTTMLKIYVLYQVCRLFGCVDVNSRVLTRPLHGMLYAIVLGMNFHELA